MITHETDRKAPRAPAECCTETECTSGLRNNYFPGKRLTPNTYSVEQKYEIERRRLINRAIHGWGVVYGYPVAMSADGRGHLKIDPGFGLDQPGRELVQTETIALDLSEVILLENNKRIPIPKNADAKTSPWAHEGDVCWLLQVHYAERPVSPVHLMDPCSCEREAWDQVCETVRYSLTRLDDCRQCCVPQKCALECKCSTGPCCEPPKPDDPQRREPKPLLTGERPEERPIVTADGPIPVRPGPERPDPVRPIPPPIPERPVFERGGCRCLCEHLTKLEISGDGPLCEIEEPCGRVRVDLRNGVPLACVKLEAGKCGWEFASVYDDCGPRRLVKRNDLLFDLVRGCDLTRIADISWRKWHRSPDLIPFENFQNAFGDRETKDPAVVTKLWVRFSRAVREETVTPDAFAITVVVAEREGRWGEVKRVPIVRIDKERLSNDEPEGHISKATLVVQALWLKDALGDASLFDRYRGRVEIEVRGDYIIDCNGQAVDANAHGLQPFPSGNGTPGGTFLSAFRVDRRKPDAAQDNEV
jgi:hypothetical protein